ncbi:MAG: 4Fe-4S dicluster domain-containing protein [Promethearchaeota archaeon]|nr:MAG: 4Fe-4S dicluster domain-containing protein [Candidatus Lokiarchaeota archaeon]
MIKQTQKVVVVDQERCIGCGTCQKICEHEAISYVLITQEMGLFEGKEVVKASIDGQKCYNCSKCVLHCPLNAIYIREWPAKEMDLE